MTKPFGFTLQSVGDLIDTYLLKKRFQPLTQMHVVSQGDDLKAETTAYWNDEGFLYLNQTVTDYEGAKPRFNQVVLGAEELPVLRQMLREHS